MKFLSYFSGSTKLVLIFIFLLTAFLISYKKLLYYEGFYLTFFSVYAVLAVGLFTAGLFLISPFLILRKTNPPVERSVLLITIAYMMLVCLIFCHQLKSNPGYMYSAEGFFSRVKTNCDPYTLQAWAVKELALYQSDKTKVLNMPDCISNIGRARAVISSSSEDPISQRHIFLDFGGGFAGFGIIVGDANFRISSDESLYVIKWVDGVYVYYGKQ